MFLFRYVFIFLLRFGRERGISISSSVCLSVHEHIYGTAGPIFTKVLCRSPVAVTLPVKCNIQRFFNHVIVVFDVCSVIPVNGNGYGNIYKNENETKTG